MTPRGRPRVVDCETADSWFFAQDANAWSSLAYCAVGVVIGVAVVQRRVPTAFLALAVAIIVEGVGSVLYHGDAGDIGQLPHDAALVATLGFVAGWHVGRLLPGRAGVGALIGCAGGVAVGIVGTSISTLATNICVAVGVIVLVAAELLARRRGLPVVWNGAALALVGLALVAWTAGTSDSPLCESQSWLQPHAVWHVLSALVVWVWVARTAAVDCRPAIGAD